ncbi:hypothetical protein WJX77_011431 [Trebouxia sp. C0004]
MQDFWQYINAAGDCTTAGSSGSRVNMLTRASLKAQQKKTPGLQVNAETTEDYINQEMTHNQSQSGSPVSHSTSQDNNGTEAEGCARTRPWTHNNPLLRQFPWPDDEDMDYTPPHHSAANSQTADVDITTPEIADIACRMDMRNMAAQALHLDQSMGSSLTILAPHAADAVMPHHSTVQRQQANKRSVGLDSFKLANHDADCIVQQINQMADAEHQALSQQLEYMLETVSAMLTAMQSVKRRKL